MTTSRTVTVTVPDDCTDPEYIHRLTVAIKGLVLGLPPEIVTAVLGRLLLDLSPANKDRQQEMDQDWSHCLDVELAFRKEPDQSLRHILQRERQEAREQERARLEAMLTEALRAADESDAARPTSPDV